MKYKGLQNKLLLTLILAMFGSAASAAVLTFSDRIEEENTFAEIDFFSFSVVTAGTVTFRVDAAGANYDAGNGTGPSTLDSYFILALDDGDRTIDDILGSDDDGGAGVDSLFSIFLNVGDYIAGVSGCCIDSGEFVRGINDSLAFGVLTGDNPDYLFTIDGGVAGDNTPIGVSSPSVFALFGLAVAGIGFRRYKSNLA